MKKLLPFILSVALMLSLYACGENNTVNTEPQEYTSKTEITDPASPDGATHDETSPEDAAKASDTFRPEFDSVVKYVESLIDTSEIKITRSQDDGYLRQNWDSPVTNDVDLDIEIKGKTVTIGKTTVGEIIDMGFQLEDFWDSAKTVSKEELEPGKQTIVVVTSNEETDNGDLSFTVCNPNNHTMPVMELPVAAFKGYDYDYSYHGLNNSSSLNDVIDTLGVPRSIEMLATYSDSANPVISLNYIDATYGENTLTSTLNIVLYYDAENKTATINEFHLEDRTVG